MLEAEGLIVGDQQPYSGKLLNYTMNRHAEAEPLMRRFGLTSSARASFALYNTLDEADAFVDALVKARSFFA